MPPTPATLFTTPNDVYDLLGTEGVQLRLDDHGLLTAQTIQVTTSQVALAATLDVMPLQKPLLPGTVLCFDGGGMPAVVEVTLAALANVGATTLAVQPLKAAIPALAQALDSGVNVALAGRLLKGCYYGTADVKRYCSGRYDDGALAQSWSANKWATARAALWVCRRCSRCVPQAILDEAEEALEEMKQVLVGAMAVENAPTRTSGWPFLSNVTVDIGYDVTKVRVEQQISELTPTQYGQRVDWSSAYWLEW